MRCSRHLNTGAIRSYTYASPDGSGQICVFPEGFVSHHSRWPNRALAARLSADQRRELVMWPGEAVRADVAIASGTEPLEMRDIVSKQQARFG